MSLLILGAGLGMVGGFLPSPLRIIAFGQAVLGRWWRALLVLLGPPLVIDGAFLVFAWACLRFVPLSFVHWVAYVGGAGLIVYAVYSLWRATGWSSGAGVIGPGPSEFTVRDVSLASSAEVLTPGNWIYWITVVGPILAEARTQGYLRVAPFFAGGLAGYYGASIGSTWLLAWGAGSYSRLANRLVVLGYGLLLVMGMYYFVRACLG